MHWRVLYVQGASRIRGQFETLASYLLVKSSASTSGRYKAGTSPLPPPTRQRSWRRRWGGSRHTRSAPRSTASVSRRSRFSSKALERLELDQRECAVGARVDFGLPSDHTPSRRLLDCRAALVGHAPDEHLSRLTDQLLVSVLDKRSSSVVSMSCTTTAMWSCVLYAFTFVGPFPPLRFSAPVMALQIAIAAGPSVLFRSRSGETGFVSVLRPPLGTPPSGFVVVTASGATGAIRTPFYGSGRAGHPSGPDGSRATRRPIPPVQ